MAKEISMEIMAPGKWNGLPFDNKRLQQIVDNFKQLSDIHSIPLKIGHADDQIETKSKDQHALGWASDVWINAVGKLMAKFVDVPDIVHKAIKNKLYKKVSVELDMGVKHKDKELGDVLSGVALLGADIPAVNTIDDLQAYLSADHGTIAGITRAIFSTIETEYRSKNEDDEMSAEELKSLKDSVANLSSKLDDQSKKHDDLVTENIKLKAEKEELERKEKERENTEKANNVKLAREAVINVFEAGVKQQIITPAQRENFHKIFNVDDDDAVVAIDVELLKNTISGGKKFSVGGESASNEGSNMNDEEASVDDRVVEETQKIMANEGIKDFGAAMNVLFSRNTKLATEYRDFNGERSN